MNTHLDGYGASIDYDGENIVLTAGKMLAKIWTTWNSGQVTIPVDDVVEIEYRAANVLMNGALTFTARHPAYVYAGTGEYSTAPDNAFVIHWRKKDQAAFDALFRSLPPRSMNPESLRVVLAERAAERRADLERAAVAKFDK